MSWSTRVCLLGEQLLLPAKTLGGDVADTSIRVNLTLAKIKVSPESTLSPVSRRDDISRHEYYGVEPVAPIAQCHKSDFSGEFTKD